jgi:hypothetical protein
MPKSEEAIEQARSHFIEKPSRDVSDTIKGLANKYTISICHFQSIEQKEKQEVFNHLVLDLLASQGRTVEEVIERIDFSRSLFRSSPSRWSGYFGAHPKKR